MDEWMGSVVNMRICMRQILQKPDHEPTPTQLTPSAVVIEISKLKNIEQMMRIFGMLENDLKLDTATNQRKREEKKHKQNNATYL